MAANEGQPTLLTCCIVIDGPSGVVTRALPPLGPQRQPHPHPLRAFAGHPRQAAFHPPHWPPSASPALHEPPVPPIPRTQTLVSFFGSRELRPLLGADGRCGLQLGPPLQLFEAPPAQLPPPPPPRPAHAHAPPPPHLGREAPPPPLHGPHGHGPPHHHHHAPPPRRPFAPAAGFGHMTWCPFSSCLYIIAGQAILRLTHDDSVSLVAGDASETLRRDGPGPGARFVALRFLTADGRGSLYAADGTRLRRIRLPAAWRAGNAWGGLEAVAEAEVGAVEREMEDGAGGNGGVEADGAGAEAGAEGEGRPEGGDGGAAASDSDGEAGADAEAEGEGEDEDDEGPVAAAEALVSTLPFEAAADVWGLTYDASREYSQLLPGEGLDGFVEAGSGVGGDGDSLGVAYGSGAVYGDGMGPDAGPSGRGGWAYGGGGGYAYGGDGGGAAAAASAGRQGRRRGGRDVGAGDAEVCGGSLIYNTDTAIYRVPLPRPRPRTRTRRGRQRHGAGAGAGAGAGTRGGGGGGGHGGRAPGAGGRAGNGGGGPGGGGGGGGVLAPWLLAGNEFEAGSTDGRGEEARFLNIFGLVVDGCGCVYLGECGGEGGGLAGRGGERGGGVNFEPIP